MKYVKWTLVAVFVLLVYGFLDYTLPSKRTVRINETANRLTDIGKFNQWFFAAEDTGTVQNTGGKRDVRFIETVRPNGKVFVYRNEDTGWIWPPYFKYDSANLHAEAGDLKSNSENPKWVSVTSYGWRISWLSIYPNAVSVTPVAGPDDHPTNWGALISLFVIFILLLLIWRMWAQFRERTIDPTLQDIDETWDRIDASADAARDRIVSEASEAKGRFRRWLDTWRGKPRP